jgi:hypothetical protein
MNKFQVVKSITLLTLLILLTLTCNNNPIKPDEDKPGRRDYVWTVDTIKIPFNILSRISGSAYNDVWAIGPGGGLNETIWHFNGMEWKTDGISRGISPLSVFAFSKDDVWLCGYEGKIWNFDGLQWKQNLDFKISNYTVGLVDIWGESPQNIYAAGYADSGSYRKAVILNYDGKFWRLSNIPIFPYAFIRIKKDIVGNGKHYLLGNSFTNNGSLTSIFEYNGQNTISQIYEAPLGLQSGAIVQNINKKTFFTIGNKINKYENGQFKLIVQVNEPKFGGQFFGRSTKDILLRMLDGIAHYNGDNIEYLYKFNNNSNISISDAVVFENDVFFLAADFNNYLNLVLRGTLK